MQLFIRPPLIWRNHERAMVNQLLVRINEDISQVFIVPIGSMYVVFTYIYHKIDQM